MSVTLVWHPHGIHGKQNEHAIYLDGERCGFAYWRPQFPGDGVILYHWERTPDPGTVRHVKLHVRHHFEHCRCACG